MLSTTWPLETLEQPSQLIQISRSVAKLSTTLVFSAKLVTKQLSKYAMWEHSVINWSELSTTTRSIFVATALGLTSTAPCRTTMSAEASLAIQRVSETALARP